MPTIRKNGCLATVGSNLYYSGGYLTPPTTPNYIQLQIDTALEMITGTAVVTTDAPTTAPRYCFATVRLRRMVE